MSGGIMSEDQCLSKENINWLRGINAVQITRDCLFEYVQTVISTLHKTALSRVRRKCKLGKSDILCKTCETENVVACGTFGYRKIENEQCECHDKPKTRPSKCVNDTCKEIYKLIKVHHTLRRPSLRNTDARRWHSSEWELAKCFLPAGDYSTKQSLEDADFNDIIYIVLNCSDFKLNIQQQEIIKKVRDQAELIQKYETCEIDEDTLNGHIKKLKFTLHEVRTVCKKGIKQQPLSSLQEKLKVEQMIVLIEDQLQKGRRRVEQTKDDRNTEKLKQQLTVLDKMLTQSKQEHQNMTEARTAMQTPKTEMKHAIDIQLSAEDVRNDARNELTENALGIITDTRQELLSEGQTVIEYIQLSAEDVRNDTRNELTENALGIITDTRQELLSEGQTVIEWVKNAGTAAIKRLNVIERVPDVGRFENEYDVMEGYGRIFDSDEMLNWAKACLSTKFAQYGLLPFIKEALKDLQTRILDYVTTANGIQSDAKCNSCTTENALDRHETLHNECPNNICNDFHNQIKKYHRFSTPSWNLTDATKWCSSPWEVGKCFLSPDLASHEVDTSLDCLISIIINCTFFEEDKYFKSMQKYQSSNRFTEVREIARKLKQSPARVMADLEFVEASYYIELLNEVLTESTSLQADNRSITVIDTLRQVEDVTLKVTADDIKTLQCCTANEDEIVQLEQVSNYLKYIWDIVEKYEKKKIAFVKDLCGFYEQEHSSLPLSPMLDENDTKLMKIYVSPTVTASGSNKNLESWKAIFDTENDSKVKAPKKIYCSAEAGTGKTSFCKFITMLWCDSHDNEDMRYFKDVHELKKFEFVFLLVLRDAVDEETWVEKLIEEQIFPCLPGSSNYEPAFVEAVLCYEKHLILLDGLDEWQNTNINEPRAKPRARCTILTTSRPYRLCESNFKATNMHLQFDIKGVDSLSQQRLVPYATDCLNKRTNRKMNFVDFFEKAKEQNEYVVSLFHVPVILLQLLCIWHDGRSFGTSRCAIYCNIIDMLFGRAESKSKGLRRDIAGYLPKCFDSCQFSKRYGSALESLSKLAFRTISEVTKTQTTVFDKEMLKDFSKHDLNLSFLTGILSKSTSKLIVSTRKVDYSFVHKSYQEFFCGLCMASGLSEDKMLTKVYKCTFLHLSDSFVFLCGMNPDVAATITRRFANKEEYIHTCYGYKGLYDNTFCKACHIQNTLCVGYAECIQNGHKFNGFVWPNLPTEALQPALNLNENKVICLLLSDGNGLTEAKKISKVFDTSSDTLKLVRVSGDVVGGRDDQRFSLSSEIMVPCFKELQYLILDDAIIPEHIFKALFICLTIASHPTYIVVKRCEIQQNQEKESSFARIENGFQEQRSYEKFLVKVSLFAVQLSEALFKWIFGRMAKLKKTIQLRIANCDVNVLSFDNSPDERILVARADQRINFRETDSFEFEFVDMEIPNDLFKLLVLNLINVKRMITCTAIRSKLLQNNSIAFTEEVSVGSETTRINFKNIPQLCVKCSNSSMTRNLHDWLLEKSRQLPATVTYTATNCYVERSIDVYDEVSGKRAEVKQLNKNTLQQCLKKVFGKVSYICKIDNQ